MTVRSLGQFSDLDGMIRRAEEMCRRYSVAAQDRPWTQGPLSRSSANRDEEPRLHGYSRSGTTDGEHKVRARAESPHF